MLDEAVRLLPDAVWWIKSDGCDVVSGLTESTKHEWTGDVDMADGSLEQQHDAYLKRLDLVKGISRKLYNTQQRNHTVLDLRQIQQELQHDLSYLPTGNYYFVI